MNIHNTPYRLTIKGLPVNQKEDLHNYLFDLNIRRVLKLASLLLVSCSVFLAFSSIMYLLNSGQPANLDIWQYIYLGTIISSAAFLATYRNKIKGNIDLCHNGVDKLAAVLIYSAGVALIMFDSGGIDKTVAYYLMLMMGTVLFIMPPAFTASCLMLSQCIYIVCISLNYPPGMNRVYLIINSILVSSLLYGSSRMTYGLVVKGYFARIEIQYKNGELIDANSKLMLVNEKLQWMSTHDSLTGIPNRQSLNIFEENLKHEQTLGVVMIDIDLFKKYNDLLGHAAGDQCLRNVARAIQGIVDEHGGHALRYGGEEFVALLPGADANSLGEILSEIQRGVVQLHIIHPASYISPFVTVSQGAVLHTGPLQDDINNLITIADEAMYQAKRSGRNKLVVVEETRNS